MNEKTKYFGQGNELMNSLFRISNTKSGWMISCRDHSLKEITSLSRDTMLAENPDYYPGILALKMAESIDQFNTTSDPKGLVSFLLHDQQITNDRGFFSLFDSPEIFQTQKVEDLLLLQTSFFHALYLSLERLDQARNYTRASLFAVWQWYNLTKIAYCYTRIGKSAKTILSRNAKIELADAYRTLTALLQDPYYVPAIEWMARLANWRMEVKEGTTLQERIFRSLFIIERTEMTSDSEIIEGGSSSDLSIPKDYMDSVQQTGYPCRAPGLFDENLDVAKIQLLDFVTKGFNTSEISRFVHSRLLPRYDFKTALQFSALLVDSQRMRRQPSSFFSRIGRKFEHGGKKAAICCLTHPVWFMVFYLIYAAVVIGIGSYLGRTVILTANHTRLDFFWINLFEVILLLIPALIILLKVGLNLVGYLLLPRLTGGIMVGYFALIFQNEPDGISNIIWQSSSIQSLFIIEDMIIILMIWLIVIAVGFFYLLFDIRPMVQDKKLAKKRAWFTLCIAVMISGLLGLVAVAVTTALTGLPAVSECISSANYCLIYFAGPAGWVDIRQFLVYVPLALLAGLVTQFIFEDKPLTAPVWSIEQPS